MSATLLLARRNLTRDRVRLVASIGGVALALSLVLALDAIVSGVSSQITSYIDHSGADVFVSQEGVRNLHMAASWLPASVTEQVQSIEGVADVSPVLYVTDAVAAGAQRKIAYVFGLSADATMGGPWGRIEGGATPRPGEVVVARTFARAAGVGVGDAMSVLGRELRISGLSDSEGNLLNTIAFVSADDFRAARGGAPVVSFVLVRVAPGASPDVLATRIAQAVPGVGAASREAFATEERGLVMQMAGDVITMMNAIGFAVGLAVVALTVYIATLARRREFGVLKAMGAPNRFLYGLVLSQAALSVVLGFAAALGFTAILAAVMPWTGVPLSLSITTDSLAKVAAFGTIIAGAGAILPVKRVAGIDPAIVFRRGAAL